MKRNVRTILGVSALFGVALGLYEYAFPWFLRGEGIDQKHMGVIYSASLVAMYLLRIYVGNHSEALGRKRFYAGALAVCGLATVLGPLCAGLGRLGTRVAAQLSIKTVREGAITVRETMHPVLIFENLKARFTDLVAKSRSVDFLGQSVGKLAGGWLPALLTLAGIATGEPALILAGALAILLAGGLLLVGAVVFHFGFRETGFRPAARQKLTFAELVPFGLPRELVLIAVAGFVFNLGLFTSHTFVLSTWFVDKFGVTHNQNGVILALHRLSLGLPLLFSGRLFLMRPKWNLKPIFVGTIVGEGLFITASALVPKSMFLVAVTVWLLHDVVGAGIWTPIQAYYIQRFAREGSRGLDVSRVQAFASMGRVFGPLAASALIALFPRTSAAGATYSDGPWLVSGLIVVASVVPLLLLPGVRIGDEERDGKTQQR